MTDTAANIDLGLETSTTTGAEQNEPEKGRVKEVRNKWLVHEDGVLAQHMQDEEFSHKYQFNKVERRTARTDVPLAKFVHTEEEERQQRDRFELLEKQRAIAQRDAELAEEVHRLEQQKSKHVLKSGETEDMVIASQLQQEELIKVEQDRIRREIRDQEYARMLYEKELRTYEHCQHKRQLARERKRLENEQQLEADRLMAGYKAETSSSPREGNNVEVSPSQRSEQSVPQRMGSLSLEDPRQKEPSKLLRTDGRVEDLGDFSDFYMKPDQEMAPHEKKQWQELQDEELARLLQDQERKRGAKVDKSRLKTLEERDAELARIMQEQERLKAKKRSRRHQSQDERSSEPHTGSSSYGRYKSEPGELPRHYSGRTSPVQRYEQQNSFNEAVNGTTPGPPESFDNPSPMYRGYGQSPYSHRPLPRTPLETTDEREHYDDRVTVVPVAVDDLRPPGSPPPPGYRPPPAYPNPRRHDQPKQSVQHTHNQHSNSLPSSQNVIAAIDPTFRGPSDPPPNRRSTLPHQRSDDPPPPINQGQQYIPEAQHHQHGEEPGYCDLDDLGPIQGQRRSTLQRDGRSGSKRSSCKQQ